MREMWAIRIPQAIVERACDLPSPHTSPGRRRTGADEEVRPRRQERTGALQRTRVSRPSGRSADLYANLTRVGVVVPCQIRAAPAAGCEEGSEEPARRDRRRAGWRGLVAGADLQGDQAGSLGAALAVRGPVVFVSTADEERSV